jgi:hypothetical protein
MLFCLPMMRTTSFGRDMTTTDAFASQLAGDSAARRRAWRAANPGKALTPQDMVNEIYREYAVIAKQLCSHHGFQNFPWHEICGFVEDNQGRLRKIRTEIYNDLRRKQGWSLRNRVPATAMSPSIAAHCRKVLAEVSANIAA